MMMILKTKLKAEKRCAAPRRPSSAASGTMPTIRLSVIFAHHPRITRTPQPLHTYSNIFI